MDRSFHKEMQFIVGHRGINEVSDFKKSGTNQTMALELTVAISQMQQ